MLSDYLSQITNSSDSDPDEAPVENYDYQIRRIPIELLPDEYLSSSGSLNIQFSETLYSPQDIGLQNFDLDQINKFKQDIFGVKLHLLFD